MELPLKSRFWTFNLTEDDFVITAAMNIVAISAFNSSAVTGTVTGDASVAGIASEAQNITQNQERGFSSEEQGRLLIGLTFNAPAGCTLQLTAEIYG